MKLIKIRASEDGQFYFVFVARNGKVIMTSETYTRKGDAIKAAKRAMDILYWQIDTIATLQDMIDDQTI